MQSSSIDISSSSNGTHAAALLLQSNMTHKRASLTPSEAAFLRALLLDDSVPEKALQNTSTKLSNDMLFSLPFGENGVDDGSVITSCFAMKNAKDICVRITEKQQQQTQRSSITRPVHNHIGLWSAFHDGVSPKALVREAFKGNKNNKSDVASAIDAIETKAKSKEEKDNENIDDESVCSDVEIRHGDKNDQSEGSSIAEDDCAPEHFDAWEVLKDEYSKDFGYDYKSDAKLTAQDIEDDENNTFLILGTSVNDKAAHPHVLSPPLMDSLMTFLPDALQHQNYWLKYSLVRDGASLNTLRRYVRGAPRTILAIETTDGQVFGSFTSDSWRNERGFYGAVGESFLWRMRHSRNATCKSLFEQAQLESEIDVFFYSNENEMIQLCNDEMLAVGGGELKIPAAAAAAAADGEKLNSKSDRKINTTPKERSQRFGFGLSVDAFMLNGSSSPCATYRNPCLVDGGSSGKSFQIVNLEVWTMTPCMSVDTSERLEMTQFFIHESEHRMSSRSTKPKHKSRRGSTDDMGDAEVFSQDKFYRRVGENDESEQQRAIWQYAKMMNTTSNLR